MYISFRRIAEHLAVLLIALLCLVTTSSCDDTSHTCHKIQILPPSPVLTSVAETKQGTPIKSIQVYCDLRGRVTAGKKLYTYDITSLVSIFVKPEVDNTSLVIFYLMVVCSSPMPEIRFNNSRNIVYNNISLFLVLSTCTVSTQNLLLLANAADLRGFYNFPFPHSSIVPEERKETFATSLKEISYAGLSLNDINNIAGVFNYTQKVFSNLAKLEVFKAYRVKQISTDQWRLAMPNLQYLALTRDSLTKPPEFPWNNSTLEIFRELRRGGHDKNVDVAKNLYIRGLDLTGNKIENLSSHEFRGFLHKLVLRSNGLRTIGPTCFHGLHGIQSIDLSTNMLTSLPENLFLGLTSLLHIDLSKNRISVINKTLFHGLTDIKRIYLNDNHLSYIEDGSFKTLDNLEVMRLDSNKIKTIGRNLFSPDSSLRELHIQNNDLASLPKNLSQGLTSLLYIDLSKNRISVINKTLFHGLTDIKRIYLNDNHLSYIEDGSFKTLDNLEVLRLDSNKIKTIGENPRGNPFSPSSSLRELYLQNNNLASLPSWIFYLKKIKKLDLSNNRITLLDLTWVNRTDLNQFLIASEMTFAGNPLTCDCKMAATVKLISPVLEKHPEIKPRFSSWLCDWPHELKGKSFLDTNKTYEWMTRGNAQNCPSACFCRKRCSDGHFVIDCESQSLEEIPSSMPQGRIELNLINNQIRDIPPYSYLENVTVLKLTKNKVDELQSLLKRLKHVKSLLLDSNMLASLPEEIKKLNITRMALSENKFKCNCNTKWMTHWLLKNKQHIRDYDKVLCSSGQSDLLGKPMYNLTDNMFICPPSTPHSSPAASEDPKPYLTIVITVSSVLCGLLLLTVITVILLYKYQGELKVFMFTRFNFHPFDRIDDSDPNKIYDAFISYSGDDYQWVVNTLQRRLENHNPPYKLCLHHRDFQVGALIQENIFKSVDHSKRMLMVLSPSFAKSGWCLLEFRFAHQKVLEDRTNYLIIILFDDVDMADLDEEIKLYMRTNTYVRVSDERFWQKLFYAMPQCSAKESVEDSNSGNQDIFAQETVMPLMARPGTVQNETQTNVA